MAPHFSKVELDVASCMAHNGATPTEIHRHFSQLRTKRGLIAPDLTTVRRALRGVTHKRGLKETRGAKVKLTPKQLRRLDSIRKELICKAGGEGEVHIGDVMAKAKLNHVCTSTVSKHFKKLGVSWRPQIAQMLHWLYFRQDLKHYKLLKCFTGYTLGDTVTVKIRSYASLAIL